MNQATQLPFENEFRFHKILDQSPFAMAILKGPRFIVDLANKKKLQIWRRTYHEVIGKPLFEIFPEVKSQMFQNILRNVYATGQAYHGKEVQAQFLRDGMLQTGYFNLTYEAYRNDNEEIEGIVMISSEVTHEVLLRKRDAVLEIAAGSFSTQFHFDVSNIGLWYWEAASGEVFWSNIQHELYGLKEGEFGGTLEQYYSFLLPDDVARVQAEASVSFQKDSYHEYQFRIRRKDGEVRWMQSRTRNILDEESNLVAVVGVNIDITDQKLLTEKLTQSVNNLRLFEQVVVSIKDAVLITEAEPIDGDGPRIVYVNEAFCKMTGYAKEEVIGRTPRMLQGPKTDRRELDKIRKALKQWQEVKVELHNYRKDGSEFCVELEISPVTDENGWFIYWVSVQRDITEQRAAEKKLRDSAFRFRNIFNNTTTSIWEQDYSLVKKEVDTLKASGVTDFETYLEEHPEFREMVAKMMVIKDVNDFTLKLFSLKSKQDLTQNLAQNYAPESKIKLGKELQAIADEQPYLKGETVLQDANGKRMTLLFSVNFPVGTDYSSVLMCMVDITPQKEFATSLEKLVQQRTYQLQRSNEDLQQFAHVASHDLKEPLRKIRVFGSRLLHEFGPSLPEGARNYLDRIEIAANCMYAMIDDVLLYSSLDAVDQPLRTLDMNVIISNIAADLELLIEETKATVVYANLHALHGIPILVYQLFYNLICNALKFATPGKPPYITVASKQVRHSGSNFIQLTVTDNGIGFSPEYEKKIFNMFTRLHSKNIYEGTGLGLTLCKKIAERHGGTIEAKGELGQGAIFTIMWPINN